MTLTTVRERARRLARVDSTFASDAEVNAWINEGKDEMSQMVGGFRLEEYLTLAARFDTETNFGINITITGGANAQVAVDIPITATARTDTTAAQVATDLQVEIRRPITLPTVTVVWSTTTYKFTIDSIDGTDITIAAPSGISYVDARDLLGFTTGSSGAQTYVSSIPEDTFVETDLATNWEQVDRMEWDKNSLERDSWDNAMSVSQQGDPGYYAVADNMRIRAWPSPSSQKLFHVAGRGSPADITAAIDFLPGQYHNALTHFAASQLAAENHEFDLSDRRLDSFRSIVKRYKSARIRGDSRIGTDRQQYGRRLAYPGSVTQ